jgi:hypothetical protein
MTKRKRTKGQTTIHNRATNYYELLVLAFFKEHTTQKKSGVLKKDKDKQ